MLLACGIILSIGAPEIRAGENEEAEQLAVIQKIGDDDKILFEKATACNRLTVIGTEKSVPINHENRMTSATRDYRFPRTFQRAALSLHPTPESGRPYNFVEMVQPIFDAKCISCHGGTNVNGKIDLFGRIDLTRNIEGEHTRSYQSLCSKKEWRDWLQNGKGDPTNLLVPRFWE